MSKKCEYCGESFEPRKPGRPQIYCCKECRRKGRYEKNIEREKLRGRKYYQEHKEKQRKQHIKKKFNLIPEEYNNLLQRQNSRCAICGIKMKERYFCVDHNHFNGVIRGLLCHKCNLALGLLNDNPLILIKAAKYLKRFMSF